MHKFLKFNFSLVPSTSRQNLDGVEHLVVPVVAIREGVLNGFYYSASEIAAFAETWNGVPVPVRHPADSNGAFLSANSPEIENTQNIGRFYNVFYDESDKALKGEIWINISKAQTLGFGDIVETLENGEMMEVSTGLYTIPVQSDGIFGNKEYSALATNIRPDHLALLPDQVGACSIQDGCGAMRNQKGETVTPKTNCSCKKPIVSNLKEAVANRWNEFKKLFAHGDVSHDDVYRRIRAKMVDTIGEEPWFYIADVFDKYFVYEVESKLYKQSYTIDDNNGEVALIGERVEVRITREYEAVSVANDDPNKQTKGNSEIMKTENKQGQGVVASLIGNGATTFTDEEKKALEGMDEGLVSKIIANSQPKVETPAPKAPAAPEAAANEGHQDPLSAEDRAALNRFKANEATRVEGLRNKVKSHYKHLEATLVDNMTVEAIEGLAAGIPGQTNFAPTGGSPQGQSNEEEYQPPSILLASNKETK